VKKWTTVDSVTTPDGGVISLHEHDRSYSIRVDGTELMSTRRHASEERLAELGCAHLRQKPGARVLIGGLGFGFTLKAALSTLAADASVVMAEMLATVIVWNQNPALGLAAEALTDPRVTLLQRDVRAVIREYAMGSAPRRFDSILLDVDNGPAELTARGNAGIYHLSGLKSAYAAVRPGGCVAYWSAAPDPAFEKLLSRAGFQVEIHRCPAHLNSGGWHTIFVGRRRQRPVAG
jgi:spermidine synthase